MYDFSKMVPSPYVPSGPQLLGLIQVSMENSEIRFMLSAASTEAKESFCSNERAL